MQNPRLVVFLGFILIFSFGFSGTPARAAAPATGVGKPAMRAATPAARATTPAGLLVPFTSAPGLMPGGGSLDPRSASHAPLVVAPTTTLGPAAEPSEPPAAGGGLQPRRR